MEYYCSPMENIANPPTNLGSVLFNAYHQRVLGLLLRQHARGLHVREIARLTGIPIGSLHRELKLLTDAGLLRRTRVGNQVHYQADPACSVLKELTAIFRKLLLLPAPRGLVHEVAQVAEPDAAYVQRPGQGDAIPSGAPLALRRLKVSTKSLASICRRHFVQRLSFFGSITRDDFGPESDVDVLAEFESERTTTLEDIVNLGDQLSALFGGRRVDVATRAILTNPYRRAAIQKDLQVAYAAR
jgi:predicted nucleotidyltransferase/DNA-binding transcriptional ArsR family regulator